MVQIPRCTIVAKQSSEQILHRFCSGIQKGFHMPSACSSSLPVVCQTACKEREQEWLPNSASVAVDMRWTIPNNPALRNMPSRCLQPLCNFEGSPYLCRETIQDQHHLPGPGPGAALTCIKRCSDPLRPRVCLTRLIPLRLVSS